MVKRLIKRPIAVTLVVMAIAIVCMLNMRGLPVSLLPDVDVPRITVQIPMPGASVREAENHGASILRSQLAQIAGLKDICSEAKMDGASITLDFVPGTRMDIAFIEVNEKIDRAMNLLPEGVERPKVVKASTMDVPAFYIDICLKPGSKQSFSTLSDYVTGVVKKRLEQLPQTAMVDISGNACSQIIIEPDLTKTMPLGITEDEIGKAISEADLKFEALSIADGIFRYTLHFDTHLSTLEDIKGILINQNGRHLRLGDICSVTLRSGEDGCAVRHDGSQAISLAIIKQSDARMEDLRKSVESMLADLREVNPDIDFVVTRDQTLLLSYSISNLTWNLALGIALACLVLFIFMRSAYASSIVIISIPLSLMVTMLCFRLFGISINVMSLAGLILGVGMMVDNSIIVIDNIMCLLAEGKPADEAVAKGATEVFSPMLSSVLTTCSVFIPLIFLSGTVGAIFYDQAMAVSISLFSSLAVAMLVIPVYFKVLYNRCGHAIISKADIRGSWMTRCYESGIKWTRSHTGIVIIGLIVIVAIGVLCAFEVRKERMPHVAHADAIVYVDWNSGLSLAANDARMSDMRALIAHDAMTTTTMIGPQGFILRHTRNLTSSESLMFLQAASERDIEKIKDKLATHIRNNYPEANIEFSVSGNIYDIIFANGAPDLEARLQTISGNLPKVRQSRQVREAIATEFPDLDFQPVAVEENLCYVANTELMSLYGVSYSMLYSKLRSLAGSNSVYTLNDGTKAVPVIVGGCNASRADLLAGNVRANAVDIPLSTFLTETRTEDYKRLHASSAGPYYPLSIYASDEQVRKVEKRMSEMIRQPDSGLSVSFAGEYYNSRALISELILVLIVAVALLYFILAAQFESLLQPLIILAELLIDIAIVLIALWLIGESVNLMSMTGIVVMCGIVINDSILKIDTINRHKRSGMTLDASIHKAGLQRLRPIVMTSLTTILAILPFMRRGDMGSDLQFPLSYVLIVGMAVGTLVSLFVIPLLYRLAYSKSENRE